MLHRSQPVILLKGEVSAPFFPTSLPKLTMAFTRIERKLLLIGIFQLIILSAAWGFFGAIKAKDPLHLPDPTARWVYDNPTYTTTLVTIFATIINTMTLGYASSHSYSVPT